MAKEYIERDNILKNYQERFEYFKNKSITEVVGGFTINHEMETVAMLTKEFVETLKEQPTADVQKVVRCGLCKNYKLRGGSKWCVLHMVRMHSDDYCSYGAKKESEQE